MRNSIISLFKLFEQELFVYLLGEREIKQNRSKRVPEIQCTDWDPESKSCIK
jgi:hypothetical protein